MNDDNPPVPRGWGYEAATLRTASVAPVAVFATGERSDDSAPPDVSIVTVTFGVSPTLPRVWNALGVALEADAAELSAEVIVVDNPHPVWGHAGADLAAVSTQGALIVRPDVNLGFGGGNNLGVDRARSELICLLNPDVIVQSGDLVRLVALARQHDADIIAPVLLNDDGSVQEMGARISSDGTTRPIRSGDQSADYASAACWVLHRERFVALDGFDQAFYPAYYEDVDLVLRLNQIGGQVRVDRDTRVVHAWSEHHARRAPDTRPQHRLLRERWADELATRPNLRPPRRSAKPAGSRRASKPGHS